MNATLSLPSMDHGTHRRRALGLVAYALVAGVVTAALFWRTGLGLNFFVWELLSIASFVMLFRRGPIAPAAWGAIAASVAVGFSVVRYASPWTLCVALPSSAMLLLALPVLLRERSTLADLQRLPLRAVTSILAVPDAATSAARLPGLSASAWSGKAIRGVGRGLFVGLPIAGVFMLLLSFDAKFGRALHALYLDIGDAGLFALLSLLAAAAYLFFHAFHTLPEPAPTPASAPPTDAAPFRVSAVPWPAPVPVKPEPRVSVITSGVVVALVALVFAGFVAVNRHELFGGEARIRESAELTYASYLHAGFAQLLVATALAVCLVVTGHMLLRPSGDRGRVPGGLAVRALEGALLILSGLTVVSCWQRLRIYEEAYGATHLRLGVAFVEAAILGVLTLTLVKAMVRGWRGYVGSLFALLAVLSVGASHFNADAYVGRRNLDRALAGQGVDTDYLRSLSADAKEILAHPALADDAALLADLRARYCAPKAGDLRAFRGLGSCDAQGGPR